MDIIEKKISLENTKTTNWRIDGSDNVKKICQNIWFHANWQPLEDMTFRAIRILKKPI
jgi:hypothetical protein